jgi:uncharacterized alkaline shock family protein YloU
MSIVIQTTHGEIEVVEEVIATLSGVTATECYGVVGMSSRKLKDGIAELLRKENFSKGITVRSVNNSIEIDLHVIVAFGTKISEIAAGIQKRVKFVLENTLGIPVDSINIYVQSVRVMEEI